MGWYFALLLAVSGAAIWTWHARRLARAMRGLREALEELTAGRPLQSFALKGTQSVAGLTGQLQKLAEEQDRLRREEANLQALLVSMGEGVLVVDEKLSVRLVNPSLMRILGLSVSPVGRPIAEAVSQAEFEEVVVAVLADEQPQQREFVIGDGQPVRHVAIAAAPMRNASEIRAVVMIVHDVTRLKKLEDVRREFVSNVSHELRTPLAIFQGYLENLMDNPDLPREQLIEVLDILQRHSTRLNLLVEDLLILARLESRSQELKLESIVAGLFLRQIANDWKLRLQEKSMTLCVDAPSEGVSFRADRFRMEQVLNNLIENALKYSKPGGRVVLSAVVVGDNIELHVQDDGVGISVADLPHVFERFFRVDKARTRERGGTGLGLSIVKHIAQSHGGSVSAESTPEKGTRIIVRLPLKAAVVPPAHH